MFIAIALGIPIREQNTIIDVREIEKMIRTIEIALRQQNIGITPCALVVAVSGGADSMGLLLALQQLQKKNDNLKYLIAVHIHHGIRVGEADRDALFVENYAKAQDIHFQCVRVDALQYAKENKLSLEDAARKERYRVLQEVAAATQDTQLLPTYIVVAHHMEDQAETVLMHLLRGAGIAGLRGMQAKEGNIIRPMLGIHREEILEYLEQHRVEYVTDSTNDDTEYTRNRVRKTLLPMLKEQFNPAITEHLSALAKDASAIDGMLVNAAKELAEVVLAKRENSIELQLTEAYKNAAQPVKMQLIRQMFYETGIETDWYRVHTQDVAELENKVVGKQIQLKQGWIAKRATHSILLMKEKAGAMSVGMLPMSAMAKKSLPEKAGDMELPELAIDLAQLEQNGMLTLDYPVAIWCQQEKALRQVQSIVLRLENVAQILKNDYTKYFDYDKIERTLCVRARKSGDTIVTLKDGGRRKLKQELIDRKVEQCRRQQVMLLTAQENVLWAVGVRRSESCLVTEQTKRMLTVEIHFSE